MSLQAEIVELTAQGWGRPQIAQALGCSIDYVRAALARHRRPDHYRQQNTDYLRQWRSDNRRRSREYKRQWLARKQKGAPNVSL